MSRGIRIDVAALAALPPLAGLTGLHALAYSTAKADHVATLLAATKA